MDRTSHRHHRTRALVALSSSVLLVVSFAAADIVLAGPAAAADEPAAPDEPPTTAPASDEAGAPEEVATPPPEEPATPPEDPPTAAPAPIDEAFGPEVSPSSEPAADDGISGNEPSDPLLGASSAPGEDGAGGGVLGATADDPPVGTLAAYVASHTRLSWNGNDYGILAFIPNAASPTLVDADGTAVGGVSGTEDFHAVLADAGGIGKVTYVFDTQVLAAYGASCAGADAFFAAIHDQDPTFSATCENFEADYFTNNGAGNDYTWGGLDNFENAGPVTVMAGDTSPATLAYDPDAEPPADGGGGDGGDFPGSDYVASLSPFAIDGTAYDDPVPGMGASQQTLWLVSGGYGPTAVTADGTAIGGLFDDAGSSIDVFLSDMDGQLTTTFVDSGVGANDCSGFETLVDSMSGGGVIPDCHAYKTDVFTPNGAEADYTFSDLDDFLDDNGDPLAATVTVADGYTAPPTLTYQVTPPGGGGDGGGQYLASLSPLTWNGTTYGIVHVLSPDSEGGTSVGADDTPIPNVDGTSNYHVALAHLDGIGDFTYVIDEMFLPSEDCAGFETFLASTPATGSCDNFEADYFTANGAGEDYTFGGLDSFENGGPVEVAPGGTDPPYLRFEGGSGGGGDAEGDHYVASNSPLAYGGVDYDDAQFGGTQPGVFYLAADDTNDPVFVEADDTPIPAIGADSSPRDIDVGLLDVDGAHVTVYADSGLVANFGGSRDCAGLEATMTLLGASVTCVNYEQSILTAPVSGSALGPATADYGFTSFDGFDSGGPVTVVDGYTDPPYLHFVSGDGDEYDCCLDAPKGEGAEVDYVASNSPLEWMGDVYDDVWPGAPFETNWAFYLTSAIDDLSGGPTSTFATNDGVRPVGIPPPNGLQAFHALLVRVSGTVQTGPSEFEERTAYLTLYVDNGVFEPPEGTTYTVDCDGFEQMVASDEFFDTDAEPTPVVECVAFHQDVLTPNQPGEDFTFNGLTNWKDGDGNPIAGDLPTVNGDNSDPFIHYDPQTRWYAATVSPWTYNGTNFTEAAYWDTETGSPGVSFGTAEQQGNEFIYENGQWPRGIPGGAGLHDFIVVLVEIDGRYGTVYYENTLADAFGVTDCPSFDDYLESALDNPVRNIPHACHAFASVALDSPIDGFGNPQCQDFTFTQPTWTDQNGNPLEGQSAPTITDGFDAPALTYIGPECESSGDPPQGGDPGDDPSSPGTDDPGSGDPGSGDPGSGDPGSGGGGDSGSSPVGGSTNTVASGGPATLPRTGLELWSLVLAGLFLVAAGVVLDRRRRVAPWEGRSAP